MVWIRAGMMGARNEWVYGFMYGECLKEFSLFCRAYWRHWFTIFLYFIEWNIVAEIRFLYILFFFYFVFVTYQYTKSFWITSEDMRKFITPSSCYIFFSFGCSSLNRFCFEEKMDFPVREGLSLYIFVYFGILKREVYGSDILGRRENLNFVDGKVKELMKEIESLVFFLLSEEII